MKIRPAVPGTIIRDPKTRRPLPDEGDEMPLNSSFWNRRLRSGEVVVVEDDVRQDDVRQANDEPTGREPVSPLTTRDAPLEHAERRAFVDHGNSGDDR